MCKDICIPEKGELDLTVKVAAAEPATNARFQAHFERRAQHAAGRGARAGSPNRRSMAGTLVVRMTPPAGQVAPKSIAFFPERELLIEPAAPQTIVREGGAVLIAHEARRSAAHGT